MDVGGDPSRWGEDEILHALSKLGADCPGNLILGEPALLRHLDNVQRGASPVTDDLLHAAYPQLAAVAMEAGAVGSSAGGEFPKFGACRERGSAVWHALVKFSGNDNSPHVQRWSDLLVCEAIAAETMAAVMARECAASVIYRFDNRTFLEVERFDRHGAFGRSPTCTWSAIMPAYDMLPMGYAPVRGVELPQHKFSPALPLPRHRADWLVAADAAQVFWDRAADDARISPDFRAICARNGAEVERLQKFA